MLISTITSHFCPGRIVPRICKTILASNQNKQPMLCFPLLLAGMPMSTYRIGESVSQKAMVGMLPSAASLIGCKDNKCFSPCQWTQTCNYIGFYLVVSSGICEDKKARLAEWGLKLISKGPRSVAPRNWMSTSVLCKLQNSSLTIRPCRLNNDVLWVFNSNNNPCSQLKFLPCFPKIYDKDA